MSQKIVSYKSLYRILWRKKIPLLYSSFQSMCLCALKKEKKKRGNVKTFNLASAISIRVFAKVLSDIQNHVIRLFKSNKIK